MVQKLWAYENRKMVVCVDSYHNGVLKGRLYTAFQEMEIFASLSQFLVKIETVLEVTRMPQSYTASRSFSTMLLPEDRTMAAGDIRPGTEATFELQILFRQHSSWQGMLLWQEQRERQSFRSVLELVLLMDSALRSRKGCVAI